MREMTETELDVALVGAVEKARHDVGAQEDDDYVSSILYQTLDEKKFIYIESSGMESSFSGAGHIGYQLEEDEVEQWTTLIDEL